MEKQQKKLNQIDNNDEYEDEDHDNEIDMIELNTAYNRVMMLIEKVTDLAILASCFKIVLAKLELHLPSLASG
jgi:hypothetical protein